MLRVTTYREAAFMGMNGTGDELRAERGEVTTPEEPVFLSGYIHGKAEGLAGYDIPAFVGGEITLEPEQECRLVLDGDEHDCLMVVWPEKEELNLLGEPISGWRRANDDGPPRRRYRFLICLTTDESALTYARTCAREQATCL